MHTASVDSEHFANPKRSWTRLDGVDLLRALAIFFVLMNHVNMRLRFAKVPYLAGLPHQLANSLVWSGQFGVQIFFAVSGFLITSTSLRRWGSLLSVRLRDFYVLRFARIAPLLFLLLVVLSAFHLAHFNNFIVPAKTGGLGRALFAALTFHVNVLEAQRGYLPANWDIIWSLSVEEMFYLFFPIVCFLLGRGKLLVVLLLSFVVLGPFGRTVLTHGNEVWREYSYLGGMDAIALGCLTALVVARRRYTRSVLLTLGSAGAVLMIFILCFSIRANSWGLGRTGLDMTILAIGTCMVITAAAQTEWRSPRLLAPFLVLGQRSYEVYLTHMFVVFGLFHFFLLAGKPMWAVPILFVAVILIAAILGEIVARFYSEPMNRQLRKRWGDGPEKLGSVVEVARGMPQSDLNEVTSSRIS
ncbi:MAG TPA: acyltransferase [Candidatus Acidoferrales bacterium]|jgi:peptidoglycan/LPS O-acetylase OafA/YrhL